MNTVITHFHNEEYLLPWWINHHKKLFDYGILIDYHSTDRSYDICKELCPPHWKIVKTKNNTFVSSTNDAEVKSYENTVSGFKIALTTTEFLLVQSALNGLNDYCLQQKSDYAKMWGVCMVDTDPHNLPTYDKPLIEQKHHGMMKDYPPDPRYPNWGRQSYNFWYGRFYHNKPFGNYDGGRHDLLGKNNVLQIHNAYVLKYKYAPWNTITNERIQKYDAILRTTNPNHLLTTENILNGIYNTFLPHAHDLTNDPHFLNAYNYCVNL